jgi:nucleotide-binding universal stress UspA family protein
MYKHILVPLENTPTDRVALEHVRALARFCGARLTLVHVADGFVARNQRQLNLAESEEMKKDREYLEQLEAELGAQGHEVVCILAQGDPAAEILRLAEAEGCDLIAMSTHGHRFPADLFLGSVADKVRHSTVIPVLMLKAPKGKD